MLTDKIIKAVHEDIPNINSQLEQIASTLTDTKTKADDWTDFKANGGTVNGDLDLVKNDITTHLGYSSFAPVSSSWSVKGGVIETPVGINLAVQPGQWSAILPFVNGDISLGNQYYKFLNQYLSGDSFATRHVGGNPGQDKRYRLAVDNDGNFTIQKITESGDWLFNIMQDANNSSGNGDMALGCADLYFGSYTKDGFGYSKIGNGFIIQWGTFAAAFSSGITDKPIDFPIAFPNRCTSIVSNMLFIGGGDVSLVTGNSVNNVTQTGFRHSARYSPGGNYAFQMCWIAIGY